MLTDKMILIWALVAGFILAFIAAYYRRLVVGSLIRAIRNAEATDPETAKTLVEIGQENNVSAIEAVRKSDSLRRLVTICNEETTEESDQKSKKKGVLINENTRLYIAPEQITRSRIQFGDEKESVIPVLLGCAGAVALGILATMIWG